MDINLLKENEVLKVSVKGRLDTNTSPQLEKVVDDIDDSTKDLIIDMEGLEYVSSAGLRVLLAAQKKMNKIGTMKVINVCDAIMEVFEITGFADILVIE